MAISKTPSNQYVGHARMVEAILHLNDTACRDLSRGAMPLKVLGRLQGLGSRIGWWLTAAALGEMFERNISTFWSDAGEGRNHSCSPAEHDFHMQAKHRTELICPRHGGYVEAAIHRVVQWPRRLHFLQPAVHSARRSADGLDRSGARAMYRALNADKYGANSELFKQYAALSARAGIEGAANVVYLAARLDAKETAFASLCAAPLPLPTQGNGYIPEMTFERWRYEGVSDHYPGSPTLQGSETVQGSVVVHELLRAWGRHPKAASLYARAYSQVQRELQPRADLCIGAEPRQYLALHLLTGDRANPNPRPNPNPSPNTNANPNPNPNRARTRLSMPFSSAALNYDWKLLGAVTRAAGLAWLVVSDDGGLSTLRVATGYRVTTGCLQGAGWLTHTHPRRPPLSTPPTLPPPTYPEA